jgi:hypothetical protein
MLTLQVFGRWLLLDVGPIFGIVGLTFALGGAYKASTENTDYEWGDTIDPLGWMFGVLTVAVPVACLHTLDEPRWFLVCLWARVWVGTVAFFLSVFLLARGERSIEVKDPKSPAKNEKSKGFAEALRELRATTPASAEEAAAINTLRRAKPPWRPTRFVKWTVGISLAGGLALAYCGRYIEASDGTYGPKDSTSTGCRCPNGGRDGQ